MTNRGVKRGVKPQIADANLSDVSGVVSFTEPNTKASRRRIALPRRLADGLTQHLEAFPFDADGLLFTAPEGGSLRRTNFRRRIWLPAFFVTHIERD